MPQGLPRKLKEAFLLQATIATIAIVVGVVVAGYFTKHTLSNQRLRMEATNFWAGYAENPDYPLPNTSTVRGFLVPSGSETAQLPPEVSALPVGISELPDGYRKVLVDKRPQGTLYLSMSFELMGRAIAWTGWIAALLGLLSIYTVTWLTYRASNRAVVPISRLAAEVSEWDPRSPDMNIAGDPRRDGREMRQLRGALVGLGGRIGRFMQREREFTRDASHELRTPLTVIRMATDLMLADASLGERAQRPLLRMQRAGRDMEAVIDAFLILGREEGIAPQSEDFDAREIVYEEVAKIQPILVDRPIELRVADTGPMPLHAPPRVLSVMLGHLLSNASAFTERGRIDVEIGDGRIVVRDTGIGMSQDILDRAYDPFYRADANSASGKGLGLAIVRRLGERMGWPVTLVSAPGAGTTATIEFRRIKSGPIQNGMERSQAVS